MESDRPRPEKDLWSEPYSRNLKGQGQGSAYNIICRTVPASDNSANSRPR